MQIPELTIIEKNGTVSFCVAMSLTLYFVRMNSDDGRGRVAECFDQYRSMVGDKLVWAHTNRGFQRVTAAMDIDPAFRSQFSEGGAPSGWELFWHGGRTKDSASPYRIRAFMPPNRSGGEIGFFNVALPLEWLGSHHRDVLGITRRWSSLLHAIHGYGGIGFVESPRQSFAQTHARETFAIASRFPGLDFDDPLSHSLSSKREIKGVNWITVLGDGVLGDLAGLSGLEMRPEFEIERYPGGLVVQSGVEPQIGDVNRGNLPLAYRVLGSVVRAARVKEPFPMHGFGWNAEQTQRWLSRFDG